MTAWERCESYLQDRWDDLYWWMRDADLRAPVTHMAFWVTVMVIGVMFWLFIFLTFVPMVRYVFAYSDVEIVNAIYKAEGGAKAQYAYGIRSVKYSDINEARRICFNTVRNNRVRFAKQNKYSDYIEFLGSRYCPVSAHKLNQYWISNVKYFLTKKEK